MFKNCPATVEKLDLEDIKDFEEPNEGFETNLKC